MAECRQSVTIKDNDAVEKKLTASQKFPQGKPPKYLFLHEIQNIKNDLPQRLQ